MSTIPTTDETMISEWTDFSTQTRAGFKLPGVVVATLIKYISENTADVPSVEEVKSGEVMSKAYAEAMAEEVFPAKKMNRVSLVQWLVGGKAPATRDGHGTAVAVTAVNPLMGGLGGGGGGGGDGLESERGGLDDDRESVSAFAPLEGGGGRSVEEIAMARQLRSDLLEHGTSDPDDLSILSAVMLYGRVPDADAVKGCGYGQDWRLTDWAKRSNKAKLPDLKAVTSDLQRLTAFYNDAARYLTRAGYTQLPLRLLQFVQSALAFTDRDVKAIGRYIQEYAIKYMGRGIPVEEDLSLMMKVKMALPQAERSAEDAAQLKAALKSIAELQKRLATVEKKKGPGKSDERKCFRCGSTEHLISQCPLKEKKEGPGSGAEEEDETDS